MTLIMGFLAICLFGGIAVFLSKKEERETRVDTSSLDDDPEQRKALLERIPRRRW